MASNWWVELNGVQLASGEVNAMEISEAARREADDTAACLAGVACILLTVDISCARLRRSTGRAVYGIVVRDAPGDLCRAYRIGERVS